MRGRHPSGPEFVRKLEGSAQAKERLEVLLETVAGTCRVTEACRRLGISEPRFDQLRVEALQAAMDRLEARPTGRPARTPSAADLEVERLQERNAELEADMKAALIRSELAVTLTRPSEAEAKKAPRSPRPKRRPRSKRSS